VVRRHGALDDVVPRYRGCAGLPSGPLQALEREVLAEVGWELFDCVRHGTDRGDGTAQLVVEQPDGTRTTWEAVVEPGRTLAVPDCGRPVEEARKAEPELAVRNVRVLSAG
jgi:hypothetical protein